MSKKPARSEPREGPPSLLLPIMAAAVTAGLVRLVIHKRQSDRLKAHHRTAHTKHAAPGPRTGA
ncbi:MAG: hypothetical protein ABWX68_03645 [Arthrobacter sp.]|uniref:hypothetical protein n=1 Tax=Arthrobacter sp. TaxID=1667 RepID=UPI00347B8D9B